MSGLGPQEIRITVANTSVTVLIKKKGWRHLDYAVVLLIIKELHETRSLQKQTEQLFNPFIRNRKPI